MTAFMSQQVCEKSFRTVHTGTLRARPPRSHDLVMLYRGLSGVLNFGREIVGRSSKVSQYCTVARYPNAGLEFPSESISEEQARRAFEVARRL
ncbi:HEPN domain-containing protein [Candidatus Bathyarchaeota archaeon]|nr:HEPN domain-containing protein [Candidatus Bathyarchaeota archaeon]